MTWTVRVPFAGEWLTANPASSTDRYGRSRAIRDWREATAAACMAARLPKDVTPVRLILGVRYAGNRAPVRDRLNLAPTIKAIVDGLCPPKTITRAGRIYRTAGYGLLPDDSDEHVLGTEWTIAASGSERAWVDVTVIHEPTTEGASHGQAGRQAARG